MGKLLLGDKYMIDNNLKYAREELEMTQEELGFVFGVSRKTISGWETGKDTIPIERLIKGKTYYYQVCVKDLVGNDDVCETGSITTSTPNIPVCTPYNTPTNPTDKGYLRTQKMTCTFNSTNVSSPTYYIKTLRDARSLTDVVASCGTDNTPGTCTNVTTKSLSANTWYKVNGEIDVIYDTTNAFESSIYAMIYDGTNYTSSSATRVSKIDATLPQLGISTPITTTNSIEIPITMSDSNSGISSYTCKYSDTIDTYTNDAFEVSESRCLLNWLTSGKTYYYKVCVTDKVGNTEVCKTGAASTKTIVKPTISVTNTPNIELPLSNFNGTYVEPSSKDTHLGIVYMDPTNINNVCDADDSKINNQPTGCKKFYIYNDDGTNYTMIMDRNLGGNVVWVSETDYVAAGGTETDWDNNIRNIYGPITANNYLVNQTNGWLGNPRMITADEIAHIVGTDREDTLKWNSSKTYADPVTDINTQVQSYYFDGLRNSNITSYSETDGWKKRAANSTNKSDYAWLFDYTSSCTSYGCNYNGHLMHISVVFLVHGLFIEQVNQHL